MLIYSHNITPRLQYITDFIGKEITGEPFQLTTDRFYFHDYKGPKINYSQEKMGDDELLITNHSLLFDDDIREQPVSVFEIYNFKAFFKTEGDYPFDIFAAAFYLLSRYEEYLPYKKDEYGRYAHQNSLAFREGFLQLPLVNIWIEDFKKVIKEKFPHFTFHISVFSFLPTYDIDEAFAFKHKDIFRTIGGIFRSGVSGQWLMVKKRWGTIYKSNPDPYDAYAWMDRLHKKNNLKPVYFFHVAIDKGRYDKNISPLNPAMQQLIKQHAEKYTVGIHPSWKSGDSEDLLEKEIEILGNISGNKITASRQHYIRFTLPRTFRILMEAGITNDYSMGYGSINGFRASVASSFYWYDLKKEQSTNLQLHPFCFMEANSFFEQKYLPQRAFEEMMHYYHAVKSVNGKLIFIWHNNFLGTHPQFRGWRDVYEEFVRTICDE